MKIKKNLPLDNVDPFQIAENDRCDLVSEMTSLIIS